MISPQAVETSAMNPNAAERQVRAIIEKADHVWPSYPGGDSHPVLAPSGRGNEFLRETGQELTAIETMVGYNTPDLQVRNARHFPQVVIAVFLMAAE